MLDDHTLTYLDVGREAIGLCLRLDRIARGQRQKTDAEAIKEAATDLSRLLNDQPPSDCPLFSTAAGLEATIRAAERVRGFTAPVNVDPLQPLFEKLDLLSQALSTQGQSNIDLGEVRKLRNLFQQIHDIAEQAAANGLKGAPAFTLIPSLSRA